MPKAVVIGGGIGGLASALALVKAGWDVRVVERAATIEPIGAALSLWSNALQALDRLGAADKIRSVGQPFSEMLVADQQGRPIIGPRASDGESFIVTRAALQAALFSSLPLHVVTLGCEVEKVKAGNGQTRVTLTDGAHVDADLVVDAAGIRSIGRPNEQATYRGYGGVVAISDECDGHNLNGLAAEYWGWGERFGLFELTAHRRYWFYMRDQSADAAPPSHADILGNSASWPAGITEAVAATPAERLIPFSIYAKPPPNSLKLGNMVHVGDAAHPMEPNLGQGACQALEDAAALFAAVSHATLDRIPDEYERLRLKRVAMIVNRSAEGRHGAHGFRLKQLAVRTGLRVMPNSITDKMSRLVQTMPNY